MVVPGLVLVVDNSGTKAPSGVDASASNGDGGQMNHEHSKSNWERCQNLTFSGQVQSVNKTLTQECIRLVHFKREGYGKSNADGLKSVGSQRQI